MFTIHRTLAVGSLLGLALACAGSSVEPDIQPEATAPAPAAEPRGRGGKGKRDGAEQPASGSLEVISGEGVADFSSEAEGFGLADRFTGCSAFVVQYKLSKMGDTEMQDPIVVKPGEVVTISGSPVEAETRSRLAFRPAGNEAVVLHNGSYLIVSKSCAAG